MRPKPIDVTNWIRAGQLILLVVAAALLFKGYLWAQETLRFAEAGRVACAKQFAKEYFERCNVRFDGVACQLEYRSDLEDYHDGVAYACDSVGPLEPMVIEWGPSLKPDSIGERQVAGL